MKLTKKYVVFKTYMNQVNFRIKVDLKRISKWLFCWTEGTIQYTTNHLLSALVEGIHITMPKGTVQCKRDTTNPPTKGNGGPMTTSMTHSITLMTTRMTHSRSINDKSREFEFCYQQIMKIRPENDISADEDRRQ